MTTIINKSASIGKSLPYHDAKMLENMNAILGFSKLISDVRKASTAKAVVIDEKGRVWRESSSEGIPTWVSTDPHPSLLLTRRLPPLKPIVIAVKVAIL